MSKKLRYTIKDRLEQIQESIDLIIERCENIHTAQEFLLSPDNVMKFDSCVMRLQAIGEQIGKILKEENSLLNKYPDIPWLAAYDMRNFISHEYASVDEGIVFDVIKEDLPQMQEAVKKILLEMDNEPNATTKAAIAEAMSNKSKKTYDSVDELMNELTK